MRPCAVVVCVALHNHWVYSQQIQDIWQTTWDRGLLFTEISLTGPINFVTPGEIGTVDITINESTVYQPVWGFGGTLTDSAAFMLSNMKSTNAGNYWQLLKYLFDATDGANAAGLSYLRVPLGATDFSTGLYCFDDASGDTSLNNFKINNAPSYLFAVIQDILSINSMLKVHVLPWSPPGWMKDSGTINGGSLTTDNVNVYANYLLMCLQGFLSQGIPVYAISIQNEPESTDPTYPTCLMPVSIYAQIGIALRILMNNNGFSGTKLIGYEHNWSDASEYPVALMDQAANAFDGVAFHCYLGNFSQQEAFYSKYQQKEIYLTECTGKITGTDWWSDIKWSMDNQFIGSIEYYAHAALMWNLAGDPSGGPRLPGTDSCPAGCLPVVTVYGNGTYSLNQGFYAMAQASKAIIPKDAGGPWGTRVGVSVGGALSWGLRVGAYSTGRVNSSQWSRFSLVVLNWADSNSTGWNPTPLQTTIEFRGKQATYTFPVGVTTLWWYA